MTDRAHRQSLTRQAGLLGISRGSLYYVPRTTSTEDLRLMRRIDELHMDFPFAGSRMLQGLPGQEGFTARRLHVATLMKRMGRAGKRHGFERTREGGTLSSAQHLEAGTGTQDLSLPASEAGRDPPQPGLRDGHHLCALARGFVYLTAVVDWFSRKVLD